MKTNVYQKNVNTTGKDLPSVVVEKAFEIFQSFNFFFRRKHKRSKNEFQP